MAKEATILEKSCLRAAGYSSDLIVLVNFKSYALHKFPLFSKSDFFAQVARQDPARSCCTVDLTGLPGGEPAFQLVASFCYGIEFEVTPSNIAALYCAATYLDMRDNNRPGLVKGINLVTETERQLEPLLDQWSAVLAVLKSCGPLQPYATEIGLVDRCTQSASNIVIAMYNEKQESWHLAPQVAGLQLDLFRTLIGYFRSKGLPEYEISNTVDAFIKASVPSPQAVVQAKEESSWDEERLGHWRRTVDALAELLPEEKADTPMSLVLNLLHMALSLPASDSTQQKLRTRAGELFDNAELQDLLPLGLHDIQNLLSVFMSPAHLSSIDIPEAAMRQAAILVDEYLKEAAADDGMTVEGFRGLAFLLPASARPEHNRLYCALDAFASAHRTRENELLSLLECILPANLSEEWAEHAASHTRWPLPFIADVLAWQKQYYKDKATKAASESRKLHECMASDKLEVEALRADLDALRLRLLESDAKTRATRAALRDEKKHNLGELLKAGASPAVAGAMICCCLAPSMSEARTFGAMQYAITLKI